MIDEQLRDCLAPGCSRRISRELLCCAEHWYLLPLELRRRIAAAWAAFLSPLADQRARLDSYHTWRELREQAAAYIATRASR
jgi:hypothetical protein